MKRRSFVQGSLAAACTVVAGQSLAAEVMPHGRSFYEWRVYSLKPAKRKMLDDYLSKALIPAVKRCGAGPVGVFVENVADDAMKIHVLIVHPSADRFAALPDRLAADEEYLNVSEEYRNARASDPVYQRIESSLLAAIEGMPKLEKPDTSRPRLLNLRIYESHNERAGLKKIEMFNKGEIAIFRRVGLTPVLFGQTVAGSAMPNLTYLLVFPDEAANKAAWGKFRDDPEWLKLKAIPEYADKEIVSKITNKLLTPTAYSEV